MESALTDKSTRLMIVGLLFMVGVSLVFGEWDRWRLPIFAMGGLTLLVYTIGRFGRDVL